MTDPTHFDRLGLPTRYDLDEADVERAYLERSRALHPDFHQQGSTAQQRVSQEMTALLNLAYTTLRQPFKRGEYLLGLLGGPAASEARDMPAAFLEEMLELRMEIQELRTDGPESPALAKMEQTLSRRRDGLVADLRKAFGEALALPEGDAKRKAAQLRARQALNAAKYLDGLLNDLRAD